MILKNINRFCIRFPWPVILVIASLSAFFMYQIVENLEFEADIMKSLPTNVKAVKSDDYYKKNFNYQDRMLIGIEKQEGSVMEVEVLRKIEKIIEDIKNLKATKTIDSQLTGKQEIRVQSIGIDVDDIQSIATMEDAVMDKETGSVVSGSVIKKLKKDHGIISAPGKEERLPEDYQQLKSIIPELTQRILQDRSFRNNLLSDDQHASTIVISTIRKWDYKKRFAILELSTALDETLLKARFQGKTSTFLHNIYGKTINDVQINDDYISDQVKQTRKQLSNWLNGEFSAAAESNLELREKLNREMTAENFKSIIADTEAKEFFISPDLNTWTNFVTGLWDFTLEQIDPFSRENLEFQLYDVKNIVDLEKIYTAVSAILDRHSMEGVNYYVAGTPVVIGVMSSMMQEDMGTLMPIAVLVVLGVLAISFRSFRGVIIPALTVVLSVIWTIGLLAVLGIPLTVGTTAMPIILLGIGAAYGIHLINRYYEDAPFYTDRKELVRKSVSSVGVAVVMAALTTIAGFSSLATSGLSTIQEFGIFAAVGVFIALILSLTLTPSLLVIWKLPNQKTTDKLKSAEEGLILRFMRTIAEKVVIKPKMTFILLSTVFIGAAILATDNHFEGSVMRTFKEDNPVFQSDRFLNKNLTGTTNLNLLFKFRDSINFDNVDVQTDFKKQVSSFASAWDLFTGKQSEYQPTIDLVNKIQTETYHLPNNSKQIVSDIQLIQDILNDEFIVEMADNSEETTSESLSSGEDDTLDGDSLDSLDDSETDDDLEGLSEEDSESEGNSEEDGFADLSEEQVLGLQNINQRLKISPDQWKTTAKMVVKLREIQTSPNGQKMLRDFNLTRDFLAVDIKQPIVLRKMEHLHHFLQDLKEPVITIQDKEYSPTGFVMTPVDLVRKFYKVFYHNDNPEFDRLPDVKKDGFTDITLTDRAINGVVLNQALSGNRSAFESIISPDLKEFQVQVMLRDGSSTIINRYLEISLAEIKRLFPDDDPYIESVRIGGSAPTGSEINQMLAESQIQSILLSFLFVFVVTFFIFRSAVGGIFALIPLAFTVMLNFGLIWLLGGEINTSTMMVASISIGTGVDYTIHFLERLKLQIRSGDNLADAYVNTVMSSGKAILMNAVAVAMGFLVLIFSVFTPQMYMGILMAATMFFSSVGALILLPSVILIVQPKYLTRLKPIKYEKSPVSVT